MTREGRNHVRSGAWIITNAAGKSGGVWSTGFSPRSASIPTTGRLSYNGPIGGLISEYHIAAGDGVALLQGKLEMDSDFSTRSVTGKITGLRVGSDGTYLTGPVNELTFTATFNAATNRYEGEVMAGPSPGGPNAFQSAARGTISGQFFGPGAVESGAVLTLSDGTSRLIISLSATSDLGCPGCWDY